VWAVGTEEQNGSRRVFEAELMNFIRSEISGGERRNPIAGAKKMRVCSLVETNYGNRRETEKKRKANSGGQSPWRRTRRALI
jgi:hypothetical protein